MQQPNKPNTTIWGLLVLAIFIAIAATHHESNSSSVSASADGTAPPDRSWSTPIPRPSSNDCADATKYENQSSSDLNGRDYSGAYHNAVTGLSKNENCSDDTDQLVNKAYLLSMKGMAEEHLSVGDSRTDLNQADMLLEQCQTKPGLYGTSTGASCETQQQYNIRTETNEDLNNQ